MVYVYKQLCAASSLHDVGCTARHIDVDAITAIILQYGGSICHDSGIVANYLVKKRRVKLMALYQWFIVGRFCIDSAACKHLRIEYNLTAKLLYDFTQRRCTHLCHGSKEECIAMVVDKHLAIVMCIQNVHWYSLLCLFYQGLKPLHSFHSGQPNMMKREGQVLTIAGIALQSFAQQISMNT